jgi:hypothetical protein
MLDIPSVIQTENNCGPASLAMVLAYYGIKTSQEELARLAGTSELGTSREGMFDAVRHFGISYYSVDNCEFNYLRNLYEKKIPVIVDWFDTDCGHYSVVCKIDQENIYLRDPAREDINVMSLKEFDQVWFDFDGVRPEKNKFFVRRAIVILRNSPDK